MKIEISYGKGNIGFDIPEQNLAGIIRPGKSQPPLTADQIDRAILNNEFTRAVENKYLCVLVPDGTRDLPINTVLQSAAKLLKHARRIRFIICTGTHNAKTEQNDVLIEKISSLMNDRGIKNFDIVAHDCEKAEFIDAGTTSRQTHVLYNAAIKDAEIFLALSDVKHHYFAGYSNPVKNLVPGVCAYKTTEQNHSLSLDENSHFGKHPWHLNKDVRNNPLAADQTEAMEKIIGDRPFWAITMISSNNKINWLQFGKAKETAAAAFAKADEWNIYKVQPVERMIVSCGKSPNDIDLYIAQRALELTKQAIIDGGEILFAAECEKGVGAERTMPHFWNLLIKPMDEIFAQVKNKPYKLFSHKPLRFAEMIKRLRKLWLYSKLPAEMIKAAHLHPAENMQTVIDEWIKEKPNVKILVVGGANKLALRV
ncbi:MAG: lactate racemase domain-containing protein [Planctomycetaceae bacterium]|nr:lactate racemase domain-containing protein [Planctomycetaceae bacterium]